MRIKKVVGLLFVAGVLFACDSPKKENAKEDIAPVIEKKESVMEKKEQALGGVTRFEKIRGYFVKNTVDFDGENKFVVVSNQEDFDTYFGVGKTTKGVVTEIDFDKFNVAGILIKPSDTATSIKMSKFTAEGGKQIVGFTVFLGDKQSFTSSPVLLFKIPKSRTSVDFVSDSGTVNVAVK